MSEEHGRPASKPEIVVVSALEDWSCAECGAGGGTLTMEDRGSL